MKRQPKEETWHGSRSRLCATLATAVLLAGCAVNQRAGFDSVQKNITERTGQKLHWNTGGAEDEQIHAQVQKLLAGELTVDEAVQIALLNNQELQATYEDLGIAQADLVQAGLLANPVISANLRFPGRPHYPLEVNVEQEFLGILFLPLRKRIAQANFEQTQAQVTDTILKHAAETRIAYYRMQGAQQLLELRQAVTEAVQANLDASRRLREAGNTKELDYANDQAMVAQARVDLSDAERDVVEAREDLAVLMGVWGPEVRTWSVHKRLPDPPHQPVSIAGLENVAVKQRQDLVAARKALASSAEQIGLAQYAAILSGASVGLDVVRDADVKTTLGPSVSAPIPIFDQGQAAAARAQSQFRQAHARYQALAVQIRSQIRKTHYRMTVAQERAAYYKNFVIPLRHRITQETQLQYNGMFIGVFGLLQAKQEEINAGARYIEALRDYWVAHAELENTVGGRLPPVASSSTIQPSTSQAIPHQDNPQPDEHHHHHAH